jgi:hypothetical protein
MRVGRSSARRAGEGENEGKRGEGRKEIAGGDTGAPGDEAGGAPAAGVIKLFRPYLCIIYVEVGPRSGKLGRKTRSDCTAQFSCKPLFSCMFLF